MNFVEEKGKQMNERFWENAVQVNDGLTQTSACSTAMAYDDKNGLIFLEHMTGIRRSYGESGGKICLCIFAPGQPTNVRRVMVDTGIGQAKGMLCNCVYLVGDAVLRMVFTTNRGDPLAAYYRDYDFFNDTLTERKEILLRTKNGDVRMDSDGYNACLAEFGVDFVTDAVPILNKASVYQGKVYSSVSPDGVGYPILCTVEDNVFVPFAVVPNLNAYEFRFYRDDSGFHGVYRDAVDDTGTGKTGYLFSADGGHWKKTVFADGIQSRPDILPYRDKPLIIYNYKNDSSIENFPDMHNHRNAIRMLYDGKVILDAFSKYGIVEHETVSIYGDLYMAYSDTAQALMMVNGAAWEEDGHPVENGKERVNFAKLGFPG